MCNLYSVTKGQSAIRELFRVESGPRGQSAASEGDFSRSARADRPGHRGRRRELVLASRGMTGPPQFGDQPVTNILNETQTAAMMFWALLASGQITMRKVDGWQTLSEKPTDQTIAAKRPTMSMLSGGRLEVEILDVVKPETNAFSQTADARKRITTRSRAPIWSETRSFATPSSASLEPDRRRDWRRARRRPRGGRLAPVSRCGPRLLPARPIWRAIPLRCRKRPRKSNPGAAA